MSTTPDSLNEDVCAIAAGQIAAASMAANIFSFRSPLRRLPTQAMCGRARRRRDFRGQYRKSGKENGK
ncbi:hypothetical protein ACLQ9R_14465 [Bordetella hinzii]|uniref:hypothetical protein n=1 Tax=Bordetella hinzii TaxID=103855 RepID=UPI0039FCFCB6